jgi:hypothetical protein
VDINLKVKEKGKQSIGLQGGVSGFIWYLIGLTYQTSNFWASAKRYLSPRSSATSSAFSSLVLPSLIFLTVPFRPALPFSPANIISIRPSSRR